jgi:hypothetical protein
MLKSTLACLLMVAATVAWLLTTSTPFNSLNIYLSSVSTLEFPWTACDQVLGGGGHFVSAVEMATVGLQVATLVVSQELLAHEVATVTE